MIFPTYLALLTNLPTPIKVLITPHPHQSLRIALPYNAAILVHDIYNVHRAFTRMKTYASQLIEIGLKSVWFYSISLVPCCSKSATSSTVYFSPRNEFILAKSRLRTDPLYIVP